MSYSLHQLEGSALMAQNITAFAGDLITVTAGWTGTTMPEVGDVVLLDVTTTNDGYYTCTERTTLYNQFRVVPTPNAEAAAGTAQRLKAVYEKQAAVAVTAFVATNVIQAATALFITNGVQINDRVIIRNSGGRQSAGGNDGAWFVTSVDSETQLTVRPLNGEANIVPGAGAGTVLVRQGSHGILGLSETGTQTLDNVLANTVPYSQQAPGTSDFCAAPIGVNAIDDFLAKDTNFPTVRDYWFVQGLFRIEFVACTGLIFNVHNTYMMIRNKYGQGTLATTPKFQLNSSWGSVVFNVGTDGGGDRYTCADGSAFVGAVLGGQGDAVFRGSYIDTLDAGLTMPQDIGAIYEVATSIFRPGWFVTGNTSSCLVESVAVYSNTAGSGITNFQYQGVDWQNVNIAKNANYSYMFAGGQPIIPVEGILKGNQSPNKLWAMAGPTLLVLNPREDYHLSNDLIHSINPTFRGGSSKLYTWNPRFVERDPSGTESPSPIQGLKVQIIAINETYPGNYTDLGTFTTAASGKLEGIETDRDGINLERHFYGYQNIPSIGWLLLDMVFSHRIIVEGRDVNTGQRFRPINEVITMRAKLDYDFPVDVLQTDFEGELNY